MVNMLITNILIVIVILMSVYLLFVNHFHYCLRSTVFTKLVNLENPSAKLNHHLSYAIK